MDMRDYEKQEELRRANELTAENNQIQRKQLEQQERQSLESWYQHEEALQAIREIEKNKQTDQFERDMDDRIFELKLEIAKAEDDKAKNELQSLLEEEKQKRESYYQEKQAKLQAKAAAHEEAIKKAQRQQLLSSIKKFFLIFFLLMIIFAGIIWYFSSSNNNSSKKSFDTRTSSIVVTTNSTNETGTSSVTEEASQDTNFNVQVTIDDLNIRESASASAKIVGQCPKGTYTIVETKTADGYTWGKLKSGKGWIALDYTEQSNTEWAMVYHYYYVQSDTSSLMQAGLELKTNGEAVLFLNGAEIMSANQGNPVLGKYIIKKYSADKQIRSYVVDQKTTVAGGNSPQIITIVPDIIIEIHISKEELQKAGENLAEDQYLIYYGYQNSSGQHVLTDGDWPMVFFHRGE
ncbi:hypothetical protein DDV21_002365 [Streptococcus chenjunshii]|uniref:SH3b domain-containing protein n=1 Tax=Streptococcus chenjunshii TaxID=2173853 RepID=A0A372KNJ2_9STRE|nr:SH3 domain-containing protein [Streptococcus chenjunshii]AXQ77996.1 hypothetical protein DDV21_002365 [Streptococcus chenjunshii]RFU51759.1 hypothetical protein DDV22_01400 [Streptococcus chenjunshii]RFU53849.1 hypothetical protein DDV23_01910 [Streptococcus chenjunshii]